MSLRRSTRRRTNKNAPLSNGSLNGSLNGSRIHHNGNQSSVINTNSSQLNGLRYSGHKRRNMNEDNDDSSSSSDVENEAHPNKRRRLSQSQQPTQSQSQPKIRYTMDKNKWKKDQTKADPIQRRSTRISYRKLADATQEDRAQIVDPMNDGFMDKIKEQNRIYKNVCHPNEAFMDIAQANVMTSILKEQTRSLANEQFTISPNDYINAVCKEFGDQNEGEEEDEQQIRWSDIGKRFALWYLTVPPISFMNGPLQQCASNTDPAKKVRQVRQKKTFTTDAPRIEPKAVVKAKKSDKTETKSRVKHLKRVLRKACEAKDGVNPFEFLINPDSYSQTIENIFDLSFVVKEGLAQMEVSREQPVLSFIPVAEKERRRKSKEENHNGQCIIKFNPKTFVNLIDVYQIKDSQIERADAGDAEDEEESDTSSVKVKVMNGHCNGYKREGNDKEEAD
eukprot:530562_1